MNAGSIQRIKFTGPLALAIGAMPFSIILCHFALIVFAIMWIADGHWKVKWEAIVKNPIILILSLFFLLHLFGIIYSMDKQTAWFNIEKKISLFALPIMLASITLEKEDVRKLFQVFLITCVVATLVCLGVAFRKAYLVSPTFNFDSYSNFSFYSFNPQASNIWLFISYIELASGIGMHPAYLSLYLSFCVLLILHFYSPSFAGFTRSKKIILIGLLGYLGIFILFLCSRIMILAFLVISLYSLNQFLKAAPPLIRLISSLIFILLFSSIVYLNPVSRFRSYQEITSTWPYLKPGLQTQSTTIRASLWSVSVKSLSKINWLVGAGTGDVEHLISETGESINVSNILRTNDPHNQYLHTLLGLGALGLSTLLICFAWPVLTSYQTGNYLYLGFIFLFSLLCLTETAMELQKGIVFYSLFNSLILFHHKPVQFISFNLAKV